MRRLGRGVWIGLALLVLSGAARPADRTPRPPSVLIAGVPHIRQEPDFCGEACVAMALRQARATTSTSARSSIAPAWTRGSGAARPPGS